MLGLTFVLFFGIATRNKSSRAYHSGSMPAACEVDCVLLTSEMRSRFFFFFALIGRLRVSTACDYGRQDGMWTRGLLAVGLQLLTVERPHLISGNRKHAHKSVGVVNA